MRLPPALLAPSDMSEGQLWRLAGRLFAHYRPWLDGVVGLCAVLVVAWLRSGSIAFGWIMLAAWLVLAARLLLRRAFFRRYQAAPGASSEPPGSAQLWARVFVIGQFLTGVPWGLTSFICVLWWRDPLTQMILFATQATWIAGGAVHNASSPATVAGQTMAALVPAVAASLLTGDIVWMSLSLFFVLQGVVSWNIARTLSAQNFLSLQSEIRMAELNAALHGSCSELEQANTLLQRLSATDALTGIGNRRAFDVAVVAEWGRATREGSELSLLMIDVDQFKAFNDFYGHPVGDECLRLLAAVLDGAFRRPSDLTARFGGEEFVALLPGTTIAGAWEAAERLRQALAAAAIPHEPGLSDHVTVSIGVATVRPRLEDDPSILVRYADQALYAAKQSGRDRVCVAGHVILPLPTDPGKDDGRGLAWRAAAAVRA